MKRIIVFLFFLNIGSVDNFQYDAQYPAFNSSIHFYPVDENEKNSPQFVKKFEALPCVQLEGEITTALKKKKMIQLNPLITTRNVFLASRKLHLTASVKKGIIDEAWYGFSVDLQNAFHNEVTFSIPLSHQEVHCIDIDVKTENIFLGTEDGKIWEFSTQDRWMKNIYDVSKHPIQGIWLLEEDKSLMVFVSGNYFFVQNRNDSKPRIRIQKPQSYRTAYIDMSDIRRLVFSHAQLVPGVGLVAYTPWDSDYVVNVPTFYLLAEGISYDHVMFLNALRYLDSKCLKLMELKDTIKTTHQFYSNPQVATLAKEIENCRKELIEKKHANLFEPMIAAIFNKSLMKPEY